MGTCVFVMDKMKLNIYHNVMFFLLKCKIGFVKRIVLEPILNPYHQDMCRTFLVLYWL